MKQVIKQLALAMERDPNNGGVYATSIRSLKSTWESQYPDAPTSNNPFYKRIQIVVIPFSQAGITSKQRYRALSAIFGRDITSSYDLTLAEAWALSQVSKRFPGEYVDYIKEVSND